MPQGDFGKLRLRAGEVRTVKADVVMAMGMKDTKYGRAALSVSEENRGTVLVMLPLDSLGDFAMTALGAILLAQTPVDTSRQVRPEEKARLIPVERIQVLDPATSDAPVGHAVVELYVGSVPLRFSAPAEAWGQVATVAGEAGVKPRSAH